MKSILITGAGGFVGQQLATALLSTYPDVHLTLADVSEPKAPSQDAQRVRCVGADLTNPTAANDLLDSASPDVVYILHGIMSSGAEANLELGLKVNFDSVRHLLDRIRTTRPGTKVVFSSSCAIYGPQTPGKDATEFDVVPLPQSSYGTQKYMIELLLNDYSRRGLLDGRIVRLPTIVVRAGAPTAAASSFVSGIVREPVHGVKSVLPVDPDIGIWICSPKTLVRNLIHAIEVPSEKFGLTRTVLLPGITATSAEILGALEKVAGRETRGLVEEKRDETIVRIVRSWPASYNTARAKELGFVDDVSLEETINNFIATTKQS